MRSDCEYNFISKKLISNYKVKLACFSLQSAKYPVDVARGIISQRIEAIYFNRDQF